MVIWRLDWSWKIHYPDGVLTWLLARALSSSLHGIFYTAAGVYLQHGSWRPPKWSKKENKKEASCLYGFVLEDIHCHIYHILFIRTGSLSKSSPHSRRGELASPLEGKWRMCAHFKTTTTIFPCFSGVSLLLLRWPEKTQGFTPMSPAEAQFLFDPPDVMVSRKCPGSSRGPNVCTK